MLVKQRLYRHNKDSLAQLDRVERIEKLEQALGSVEVDYARLLRAFDARGKVVKVDADGALKLPVGSKRPSAQPESEDEDGERGGKRIKFS